jgi:hypothetical protein
MAASSPMTERTRYISAGLPTSIAKAPSKPGKYLGGMMGPASTMYGSSPLRGVGKTLGRHDLGSVVGRRGAGITPPQVAGGDPAMHSMGQYGKSGIQQMTGGAPGAPSIWPPSSLGPGF